jgi:hypothetical protein
LSRIRHWWLRKTKQTDLSFEAWRFVMDLTNFNAAAANLSSAADALIAKASSDAAALAQAQSDLAGVDQTTAATVQAEADKINAALQPLAAPDPSAAPTS